MIAALRTPRPVEGAWPSASAPRASRAAARRPRRAGVRPGRRAHGGARRSRPARHVSSAASAGAASSGVPRRGRRRPGGAARRGTPCARSRALRARGRAARRAGAGRGWRPRCRALRIIVRCAPPCFAAACGGGQLGRGGVVGGAVERHLGDLDGVAALGVDADGRGDQLFDVDRVDVPVLRRVEDDADVQGADAARGGLAVLDAWSRRRCRGWCDSLSSRWGRRRPRGRGRGRVHLAVRADDAGGAAAGCRAVVGLDARRLDESGGTVFDLL